MDKIQKITDYLIKKYNPSSIILFGSRSTGKNTETSDWDILLFSDEKFDFSQKELFEGELLDVKIVQLPIIEDEFIDDWGLYLGRNSKVIIDSPDEFGQKIIDKCKKYYAIGRKYTPNESNNWKVYMSKLLTSLERYKNDPMIFTLYIGFFYERALRHFFELRGGWSLPIYEAISEIQKMDKDFYVLLEALVLEGDNKSKLVVANEIYSRLFTNNK